MRLIDADELLKVTVKRNGIWNAITNSSGEGLEEIINSQPTIEISDNATNGDVIKAMFPELEIANDSLSYDNLAYIMAYFGGYKTGLVRGSNSFERTWWDAPYKGGE